MEFSLLARYFFEEIGAQFGVLDPGAAQAVDRRHLHLPARARRAALSVFRGLL